FLRAIEANSQIEIQPCIMGNFPDWQSDPDIMLAFIKRSSVYVTKAAESLKASRAFFLKAIEANPQIEMQPCIMRNFPDWQSDPDIMLAFIKRSSVYVTKAAETLKKSK